jgi:periplasmic divalent cation tolerance protein
MTGMIQVLTTVAKREDGQRIATALVQQRLAACVQVSGPLTSCYRWQGQLETADEWLCAIKTTERAYAAVEAAIHRLHDYDEPEIVAVPIVAGSRGYLDWLAREVDCPRE